jgi:hypothetical protein
LSGDALALLLDRLIDVRRDLVERLIVAAEREPDRRIPDGYTCSPMFKMPLRQSRRSGIAQSAPVQFLCNHAERIAAVQGIAQNRDSALTH